MNEMHTYGKHVLRRLHEKKPEQYMDMLMIGSNELLRWMTEVDSDATEQEAATLHEVLIEGKFVHTTPAPNPRMPALISKVAVRGLEHIEQIPPELFAIEGFTFLISELVESVDDLSAAIADTGSDDLLKEVERVTGFTGAIASLSGLAW